MKGYEADFSFSLESSSNDETALPRHKALMFSPLLSPCIYGNILSHISPSLQESVTSFGLNRDQAELDAEINCFLFALWLLLQGYYIIGTINIIPYLQVGISGLGRGL